MKCQRQNSNDSTQTDKHVLSHQIQADKNLISNCQNTQTRIKNCLPTKQSLQTNPGNISNLQQIQEQVECEVIQPQKKRLNQFLFSFFISLVIPMVNTTLMTSMMIQLKDKYVAYKSWTCVGLSIFMFVYFVVEGIVRFGFIKVLKYYFYPDRLLPGIIISSFAYLAMTQQTANRFLYNKVAQITFTFWFFSMAGNLRLSLKQYDWSRWQIFLTKLAYLYSGTTIFYAGFCYIYSEMYFKFPKSIRDHVKDLVLLFIFGTVEAFYQHYKFISNFDGTQRLMPPINFQQVERRQLIKKRTGVQITRLMKRISKEDMQRKILK